MNKYFSTFYKSVTFIITALNISNIQAQDYLQSNTYKHSLGEVKSYEDWITVDSIYLYGGGKLLNLVTANDDSGETTTPAGSLGFNFKTDRLSCNLYYSYSGISEISMNNLEDFGNILMNPDRGGQALSFTIRANLYPQLGLRSEFQVLDQEWKLDSITSVDASPLSMKFGLFYRPFKFSLKDNEVDFVLFTHFTHRTILGEFGNNTHYINETEIKPQGFNGIDISANIYFNALRFYVQYSHNKVKDFDVNNFSGNQIVFGLEVTGKVIKLK